MTSIERALRAMRARLQFDLAEIGAAVQEATASSTRAQREESARAERCKSAAHELRGAMSRGPINPALLDATRRRYLAERRAWNESRTRLTAALEHEERARAELAETRNRERSLDRALSAEHRQSQRQQQSLDMLLADEMWLQRSGRGVL